MDKEFILQILPYFAITNAIIPYIICLLIIIILILIIILLIKKIFKN